MPNFNKVILIGHLTRDPELRYTPGGSAVANCSIATNRRFKSNNETKDETCFVEFTTWGKQAEMLPNYFKKGDPILVEGRLSQDTWQDKDTGANRSKLYVTAENISFIAPKEGGGQSPAQQPAQQNTQQPPQQQGGVEHAMADDYNMPRVNTQQAPPPQQSANNAPQQQAQGQPQQGTFNPNLGTDDDIPF